MKTTYEWLKEYVDIKIGALELADLLTMSGSTVASVEKKGSDTVYEFEIMSNRPDCLSAVGIAREVAALTGKKIKLPPLKIRAAKKCVSVKAVKISIRDKKLCPRYTGRVIRDVKVASSPKWLQDRLVAIGLRPVNNVVDVTNFCLFELGQPMHAFDLDKISGGVEVRPAGDNEKIIAIDGVERKLEKGMLVIADSAGPIAVAGVMGGLYTEVGGNTKNILLESAYFDPVSVRRASRKLGLSSPSSYRFERGVDSGMVLPASNRAASLINELAGGAIGELIDAGSKTAPAVKINFDIEKSNAVLGVEIKKQSTKKIFAGLGLGVKDKGKKLEVAVPSFRNDLRREIDLTEEQARIHGYDKIPLTIPRIVGNVEIKDEMQVLKDIARKALCTSGLSEIVTYSLVSEKALEGLGIEEGKMVSIQNPLSVEQKFLSPALLPGMLNAISWNINRKAKDIMFFEIGKLYAREGASYSEEEAASIGITGDVFDNWSMKEKKSDFFYLKGIAWNLLRSLGAGKIRAVPARIEGLAASASSRIETGDGKGIGIIGKVDEGQMRKYDLGQDVFFAQISLRRLLDIVKMERRFRPVPKYPSIERDISIVIDRDVPAGAVINIIESMSGDLIKNVSVFDVYHGGQIPDGKKSISVRIEYRDDTKTLTDEAVKELHEEVKRALKDSFTATFR